LVTPVFIGKNAYIGHLIKKLYSKIKKTGKNFKIYKKLEKNIHLGLSFVKNSRYL
jgi:hypothetical protein